MCEFLSFFFNPVSAQKFKSTIKLFEPYISLYCLLVKVHFPLFL